MRTVVAKFGGTSLADANQFRRIKEIVSEDPDRRYIVASAPGKRFPEDQKVTDLLLRCWEEASDENANGNEFEIYLEKIRARFNEIISELNETV